MVGAAVVATSRGTHRSAADSGSGRRARLRRVGGGEAVRRGGGAGQLRRSRRACGAARLAGPIRTHFIRRRRRRFSASSATHRRRPASIGC